MRRRSSSTARVAALLAALLVAGCSTAGRPSGDGAASAPPGRVGVSASFYPLAYAVTQVGGDRVAVSTLTEPGVEPHDLELTPADVAHLRAAALVVYLSGLSPAVDAALAGQAGALDVSGPADLVPASAGASSAEGKDPHFWLDPERLAAVGRAIADRLAVLDPASAATYRNGAAAFEASLRELDGEYRAGLAHCARRQLVTTHAAFGYLARRYAFVEVPITGLRPHEEPSARQLAAVAATVRDTGATTVYTETLVDSKYAETVAASTGATTAVLDPVEGLSPASRGATYLEVMRSNLATLRAGQGCS